MPIKISINTKGELQVSWEGSIQTPYGTFSAEVSSNLADLYPEKEGVLIVNVNGVNSVYDLNARTDITIKLDSGYYKQVELRKEGSNWYFEAAKISVSDLPTAPPIITVVNPTVEALPLYISSPSMGNFAACSESCNGSNSRSTFPEGITKIYIEWDYENIPHGARYIRKWTMNEKEWIKYDCTWTGSETGRDSVKLTEPKGLHSGTWQLTIIVDGNVLLTQEIKVNGNWDFWDPAGTLNSCYGTTN